MDDPLFLFYEYYSLSFSDYFSLVCLGFFPPKIYPIFFFLFILVLPGIYIVWRFLVTATEIKWQLLMALFIY